MTAFSSVPLLTEIVGMPHNPYQPSEMVAAPPQTAAWKSYLTLNLFLFGLIAVPIVGLVLDRHVTSWRAFAYDGDPVISTPWLRGSAS